MFFRTKDGRAYPVSRIRAIHPPRPDAISVSLDGGEVVEAWPGDIAELARRPVQAFAAQAGAYVVRIDEALSAGEASMTAVLGWSVGMDGRTYPVTVNGVNDGVAEALAVLTADGKVSRPDADLWDSIDACVDSLRAALKAA
ncbi:MAG TPA: hypothetical protein VN694_09970 [Caulobacteraceae bacterium]|nr:hypothetical protein [Caulobacteraceae bacterium]